MRAIPFIVSQIVQEAVQRSEVSDAVAASYAVYVEVGIELSKLFTDMRFQERKAITPWHPNTDL